MKQGEFVMLYRAYCGNNGHKRKISVAVRPTESHRTNLTLNQVSSASHSQFQALLSNVLQTHVDGLAKTGKPIKRKTKATQFYSSSALYPNVLAFTIISSSASTKLKCCRRLQRIRLAYNEFCLTISPSTTSRRRILVYFRHGRHERKIIKTPTARMQ